MSHLENQCLECIILMYEYIYPYYIIAVSVCMYVCVCMCNVKSAIFP